MCCLFWPPPNAQALDLPYTTEGWLQWWKRSTFARSLQLLLQVGHCCCRSQPTDAHRRRVYLFTTSPLPQCQGWSLFVPTLPSPQRMLFATFHLVDCNVSEGLHRNSWFPACDN